MTKSRQEFLATEYEPPVGPLEALVARIQAEVLGIDRIGRNDSFFDFDGTSLHAIKVCARIEAEAGLPSEPHWLFEQDVIADLAARINSEAEASGALATAPGWVRHD